MGKIEIIIFDADGTIFDSMPFIAKIFADMLKRYDIPIKDSKNYLYATAGTSTYEQFRFILKKYHKSTDKIGLLVKEFNDLISQNMPKLFTDVNPVLKKLGRYKKIVSTNLRQDVLNKRIKNYKLDLYLEACLGTNGFKSKEEHFDEIKKRYDLSIVDFRKKVILIGDGKKDMEFAREYGITGIGRVGINDSKTLNRAGASYVINDLFGLIDILKK